MEKVGAQPGHRQDIPDDVIGLCRDLIRINTSNPTHGEGAAARYVAAALDGVGINYEWFEPVPDRVSIVARLPGRDPSLSPLLVHTHLDVVPAVAEDWSVDPFGGVVRDGCVWGRGAVDMKGMVAAVLAVARAYRRDGAMPRRDLVLAFFADEEAGGQLGAGFVTQTRPDLFDGCQDAIGEVGGFSRSVSADRRCYFVSTAEKGVIWAQLTAHGIAGHGSMINPDNAVSLLSRAVTRIADHAFEPQASTAVSLLFEHLAKELGLAATDTAAILTALGPMARMIQASTQDTLNPTSLTGGYKVNVIPGTASATVDGRFIPGHKIKLETTLRDLAGERVDVDVTYSGPAIEAPWDGPLIDHFQRALEREDPSALVIPYMSTAFTDAKWLSQLGIRCYGFSPLQLPDDLDFTALFHGVDERVPVTALEFSVRVLRHLFEDY